MDWSDIFTYCDVTGILVWKTRNSGSAVDRRFNTKTAGTVAGALAGNDRDGYRGIAVGYKGADYYAHRIVWEMHHGPIPEDKMIDHVNGNPLDNRLSNIRLATRAQNNQNQKLGTRNTSGVKGVFYLKDRNRWRAEIRVNNRIIRLGKFKTKGLAAVARAKAAIRYHGAFARF